MQFGFSGDRQELDYFVFAFKTCNGESMAMVALYTHNQSKIALGVGMRRGVGASLRREQ